MNRTLFQSNFNCEKFMSRTIKNEIKTGSALNVTGGLLGVTGSDFYSMELASLRDSQCDINLMRTIIKQIIFNYT